MYTRIVISSAADVLQSDTLHLRSSTFIHIFICVNMRDVCGCVPCVPCVPCQAAAAVGGTDNTATHRTLSPSPESLSTRSSMR